MCIAEAKGVDTICFNSSYVDSGCNVTSMNPIFPERIYEGTDDKITLIESLYVEGNDIYTGDFFRAVWGKIFSADIINNNGLNFPCGVPIGEDAVFMIKYIFYSNKILLCNSYVYKYYRTNESVTGMYKDDFYKLQVLEFHAVIKAFKQCNLDYEKVTIAFWHKAEKTFIENELKSYEGDRRRIKKIANYLMADYLRLYLTQYNGKGMRVRIRSLLEKYKCYYLLALIDYYIIKRKLV